MVGVAEPAGMAQVGAGPEAGVWETPGPETVQEPPPGTLEAVQVMVAVLPCFTRTEPSWPLAWMEAVAGPEQVPPESVIGVAVQVPPVPVQESV